MLTSKQPHLFRSAKDGPVVAAFDDSTDDSAALNGAQQDNSTLWLPNGTARIAANSLAFKKSKQHIRGQGMFASGLRADNPTSLNQLLSQEVSGYAPHVVVEDLTIDGALNTWNNAVLTAYGPNIGRLEISRVNFVNVGSVETTALHVEEWLDQTTYQPVLPPAVGAAYTVYKTQLGLVSNVTATTLTVNQGGNSGWFDMTGTRSTPANGTLYEVCGNTTYPVQLSQTCDAPTVAGGTIRRAWADLVGLEGCSRPQVIGVLLEDGQDSGVTPDNGTTGGIIDACTIRHCGAQAISADNWTDGILGVNQYEDNTWANNSGSAAQVGLLDCTRVQVLGGKARASGGGQSPIGLALKGTSAGCKILGFEGHGHSLADIWVRSAVVAAANEILDCTGTLVYESPGTNRQFTRTKLPPATAITSFLNSWANTGSEEPVQWTYDEGVVHVWGDMSGGASSSFTEAFVLPSDLGPPHERAYPAYGTAGGGIGIAVETNDNLYANPGTGSRVAFDITYRLDV